MTQRWKKNNLTNSLIVYNNNKFIIPLIKRNKSILEKDKPPEIKKSEIKNSFYSKTWLMFKDKVNLKNLVKDISSNKKEIFLTLGIGFICCMLYFIYILFGDGYEEISPLSDIDLLNSEKKDVSERSNLKTTSDLKYKEKFLLKKSCSKNIFINEIKETFNKYKFYSGREQSPMLDNKIVNQLNESLQHQMIDPDLTHLPCCTEDEKKYNSLKLESLKVKKEFFELQERLDLLSIGKHSKEFNKLSSDVKNLAQENICDEKIYLKKKKNETLNKLSNLHFEMINILHIRSKKIKKY